jgi:dTDP-4-dehydrorhamnose 3,5-epimerase
MGNSMIEGVLLTPLRVVANPKGDIYHAIKASAPGYQGFGEAYFSTVTQGITKGWKRHNRLALNLVVPVGEIEFTLYDGRTESSTQGQFFVVNLGIDLNYQRLTVPPGIWVAFQGGSEFNLLMNLIAEEHDPSEADNIPLEDIPYPSAKLIEHSWCQK